MSSYKRVAGIARAAARKDVAAESAWYSLAFALQTEGGYVACLPQESRRAARTGFNADILRYIPKAERPRVSVMLCKVWDAFEAADVSGKANRKQGGGAKRVPVAREVRKAEAKFAEFAAEHGLKIVVRYYRADADAE